MRQETSSVTGLILLIAWLIALAATLFSLYAGEILGMPVCLLCWFQRIFIYPLAIQLGIACFRSDAKVIFYALPLAALGALVAGYHYLLQMFPAFAPLIPCRASNNSVSCEQIDWQWLGFITFPLLSFAVCVSIVCLLIIAYRRG